MHSSFEIPTNQPINRNEIINQVNDAKLRIPFGIACGEISRGKYS